MTENNEVCVLYSFFVVPTKQQRAQHEIQTNHATTTQTITPPAPLDNDSRYVADLRRSTSLLMCNCVFLFVFVYLSRARARLTTRPSNCFGLKAHIDKCWCIPIIKRVQRIYTLDLQFDK